MTSRWPNAAIALHDNTTAIVDHTSRRNNRDIVASGDFHVSDRIAEDLAVAGILDLDGWLLVGFSDSAVITGFKVGWIVGLAVVVTSGVDVGL